MDYRNDYENHFNRKRGSGSGVKIAVAAVAGGLIGALAMAVIAPYFLYGSVIPWPDHLTKEMRVDYQLPESSTAVSVISEPSDSGSSITSVAEGQGPSVVGIINKGYVRDWFGNTSLTELASGSGFIIDPAGLIVTNEHVISNAEEVEVILSSGTRVIAEIVGLDEWSDLAVLEIDLADLPEGERSLPYVTFGDSSELRVGQTVIAIGNPLGMEFARTVTAGIVSAVDRIVTVENRQYSLIQTDAAINSGNSGGPLLDTSGHVIGINQIKISDYGIEGLGFAIPSNQAKPIIEQLISSGSVQKPYLGIKGQTVHVEHKNLDNDYGIAILEVAANSPIEAAGVQPDDIITAIEGEVINSFTELQRVLYNQKIGDTIMLEVLRPSSGEVLRFDVFLSKAAAN